MCSDVMCMTIGLSSNRMCQIEIRLQHDSSVSVAYLALLQFFAGQLSQSQLSQSAVVTVTVASSAPKAS